MSSAAWSQADTVFEWYKAHHLPFHTHVKVDTRHLKVGRKWHIFLLLTPSDRGTQIMPIEYELDDYRTFAYMNAVADRVRVLLARDKHMRVVRARKIQQTWRARRKSRAFSLWAKTEGFAKFCFAEGMIGRRIDMSHLNQFITALLGTDSNTVTPSSRSSTVVTVEQQSVEQLSIPMSSGAVC